MACGGENTVRISIWKWLCLVATLLRGKVFFEHTVFLAVRPGFSDLGRRATVGATSLVFDPPNALLEPRSSCAPVSRAALFRNPGSRCTRIQPDHCAAMSCVDVLSTTGAEGQLSWVFSEARRRDRPSAGDYS